MKTVDMHVHLLSSEVQFNRLYDKMALLFFAKRFGLEAQKLFNSPYDAYVEALMRSIQTSSYVDKIALFGVDACYDDDNTIIHRDPTVCASNDDVLKLYQQYPDTIIPFFSINPKRHDALELIDTYVELGFKGAKFLQNYWGVDTREKRYEAYFDKLAAYGIPLIVHVGSESSVPSQKACESLAMVEHPLQRGVTVICAHMALSYNESGMFRALSRREKHFNEEYFEVLKMLETHDNLYADVSAMLTPVRAKALRHLSQQTHIHHKLLFGSDFPVPFTILMNSYDLSLRKRLLIALERNVFDRYTRGLLEYFPSESCIYSNYTKILKK